MSKHIILLCLLSTVVSGKDEQNPHREVHRMTNFLQNYLYKSVRALQTIFSSHQNIVSVEKNRKDMKTKAMKLAVRRLFSEEKPMKGKLRMDRQKFQNLTQQIQKEIKEMTKLVKENIGNKKIVAEVDKLFQMEKTWFNRIN